MTAGHFPSLAAAVNDPAPPARAAADSDASGERARNGWIDVFRGLAAAAVVLFHFNVVPLEGTPGAWTAAWRAACAYGYLGVEVFFVLSGYCVTSTWLQNPTWRDFSRRRLRRILPPYYWSLALVLLVVAAHKLLHGVNDVTPLPATPVAVLATLTLATNPVSGVPTMNWVYWSLSYELAFYAVLAVVLGAVPASGRIRVLAGLHVVICALGLALPLPATGPLFFLRLWPLFGLGAALAVCRPCPAAGKAMIVASLVHAAGWIVADRPPGALLVAFLTALAVAAGARSPLPRLLRPLRELGLRSYSLYLVHVPIGIYGLLGLMPSRFPSDFTFLALQGLAFAGTIALAVVFFHFAERPFLRRAPRPS